MLQSAISVVKMNSVTQTELCSKSSLRVRLELSNQVATPQVYYSPGGILSTTLGIPSGSVGATLVYDIRHHGDMVQQDWYGIAVSNANPITVVQIMASTEQEVQDYLRGDHHTVIAPTRQMMELISLMKRFLATLAE